MIAQADAAPRRVTRGLISVAFLVGIVVLAWWQMLADATQMPSMLDGLARAGRAMAFDTAPAGFAATWTVMMAAMMLPGFIATLTTGREVPLLGASAGMASGYLAVWMSTAAIAFGALTALNRVGDLTAGLDRTGGVILLAAGAYQFTGYKRRLLANHDRQRGNLSITAAFGVGLAQGVRCLGSSWALMSVLLVVGVMNLTWMATISVICLAEKALAQRIAIASAVGLALAAVGFAVLIAPQALQMVAGLG